MSSEQSPPPSGQSVDARRKRLLWTVLAFLPVLLFGLLVFSNAAQERLSAGALGCNLLIFCVWWLVCSWNLAENSTGSPVARGASIVGLAIAFAFLNLVAGAVLFFAGCALMIRS
jgi:hypothetical protein